MSDKINDSPDYSFYNWVEALTGKPIDELNGAAIEHLYELFKDKYL